MSDWGQGAKNNNIGWGQGAVNNDISWGSVHADSWAGDTDIVGSIAPSNTIAPVISGTNTIGSILTTTNGTWSGTLPITYTYQWLRNGSNISGATSSTYTLVVADRNANISCQVTATNSLGSANATSNSITAIYFLIAGRFSMLVDSRNLSTGSSANNQFAITGATVSTGTTFLATYSPESDPYNYTNVTLNVSNPVITFPTQGRYYVQVQTPFNRITFNGAGDRLKLIEVNQWGNIVWTSFSSSFVFCSNFIGGIAIDVPNLSIVTNMNNMFNSATNFNQNIGGWNVSNVTNMNGMFQNALSFNQNIGSWNVSNVTNFTNFMAFKTSANFSASNLDAIYNGWSSRPVKPNLSITFGTAKYTLVGQAGKNILLGAPNLWTITDGGI